MLYTYSMYNFQHFQQYFLVLYPLVIDYWHKISVIKMEVAEIRKETVTVIFLHYKLQCL